MDVIWFYVKRLLKNHKAVSIGVLLTCSVLLINAALVSVAGWFITSTLMAASLSPIIVAEFNFFSPGALIRTLAITRTLIGYLEKVINHNYTLVILVDLRVQLFKILAPVATHFTFNFRKPDLLHRLIADIDSLNHLYLKLIVPFICALIINFLVSILFIKNLVLFCVWLLYTSIVLVLLPLIFFYIGQKNSKLIDESYRQMRIRYHDYLSTQTELRVFGALDDFRMRAKGSEHRLYKAQKAQTSIIALSNALYVILNAILFIGMAWYILSYGFEVFFIKNLEISLAIQVFIAFLLLSVISFYQTLHEPFANIGATYNACSRLYIIENTKPIIIYPKQSDRKNILKETKYKLTFRNVSFMFPEDSSLLLNKVNIEVKSSETIAIIGHTGCGKSTFLNLILRDFNIDSGDILLNNNAISNFSEKELRHLINIVPQRTHIFNDTLQNNLLPTKTTTEKQLLDVLEQVKLSHLIQNNAQSHKRLSTWLGETGRQLSGGERQRLGIARTLLRNAPIVLFDEPTEALDVVTEIEIISMLKQFLTNKIAILVTHKPKLLDLADKVYQLELGKLKKI